MHLSTKGRYAVMAMVAVAERAAASPASLGEIATRLDLSQAYLEQLFMKLRRSGLVRSVRGPGGGYVLARGADPISVSEIMAAVEEPLTMTRCASERLPGCVSGQRCATHGLWAALEAHIEAFLDAASLADVTQGRFAASRHRVAIAASMETAS